jgi:hypothetical protein
MDGRILRNYLDLRVISKVNLEFFKLQTNQQ